MMKRSSDNQYSGMSANGSSLMDLNAEAKKPKIEGGNNKPSRVVHIRGVPNDATEGEVVQLGLPFGRMTNLVVARKKNQALLEMSDVATAQAMVSYYTERPPQIRNRIVYVQFSTYEQLKTENSNSQVALQVADQMIGGMDEARTVLRVIVDNMLYPITIDILKMIFSKYGQVLRIVTYNKNNSFQALIQLSDAISAKTALSSLNNQNIYNGCCTLRIDFSHLPTLQVKYNNDKTYDFTNPNLPTGNQRNDQPQNLMDNSGDGILGSFNGPVGGQFGGLGGGMGNFGGNMGNMGGMQGIPKLGGAAGLGGMGGMGGNMSGMGGGMGGMGGMNNMGGMSGLGNMGGMMGMGMGGGGMGGNPSSNSVVIVSNLCEEKVNPDVVFALFGVYGMVMRVKIMYNKKDTALVQFSDPVQAQNAVTCLDKVKWWGKNIKVSMSKHSFIQMPKEGQSDSWLTKDYSSSNLHRSKQPNAKTYANINPPSAVLHVSNLPASATEEELRDLFSKYGNIEGFRFLEKEKKMALIQLESVEEAVEALAELHGFQLQGMNLRVSFTKSQI